MAAQCLLVLAAVAAAVVARAPAAQAGEPAVASSAMAAQALAAAQALLPGGVLFGAPPGRGRAAAASTGLPWPSEASWQAANTLETLTNVASRGGNATLVNVTLNLLDEVVRGTGGFPRDFEHFDDFGWWALALLRAATVLPCTAEQARDWVAVAETVFAMYAEEAWNTTVCGGGVFWGPVVGRPSYKNAITNELFLALCGRLHVATGDEVYRRWAEAEWAWLGASGMQGDLGLYNDGLDGATCANNNQTTWTYNQGVILSGLALLAASAPPASAIAPRGGAHANQSVLSAAARVARAAMGHLSSDQGVLQEPCEVPGSSPCSGSAQIFKGVFARHLWYLSGAAAPGDAAAYGVFLQENAASAVARDRVGGLFGLRWTGPMEHGPVAPANAATQTAALDLLVAAAWVADDGTRAVAGLCPARATDAVGAWRRPGWRCTGSSVELVARGRPLHECQAACRAVDNCSRYTFTEDGVLGSNSICNAFPTTAPCALASVGCGGHNGCRYTSGSKQCL